MVKNREILNRRIEKILPNEEALLELMEKQKIKLYQGFDPTGGRLHLGHSVGIRKLMDFANLGHEVIFLFGTGTVLVGDPSERDSGRKLITQEEIQKNIMHWKEQVDPLVDWEKVTIMQNGDWLSELKLQDIINIASNISAVQLFKRDSFQRRIDKGDTVWYHETMYPLLQGYDSVIMDVDLEIGGTDQEFNMLIGRELQKKMNNREKYVLTTPMILGTDGQQMSKTTGNCVWLDDDPNDMYGKLMSIPDGQIISYMKNVTDIPLNEIEEIDQAINDQDHNPIDAKKRLAYEVVKQIHTQTAAEDAKKYFLETFQQGHTPNEIPFIKFPEGSTVLDVVTEEVGSRSEAKRLIQQGAIYLNEKPVEDFSELIKDDDILKIGKKKFVKIKIEQ